MSKFAHEVAVWLDDLEHRSQKAKDVVEGMRGGFGVLANRVNDFEARIAKLEAAASSRDEGGDMHVNPMEINPGQVIHSREDYSCYPRRPSDNVRVVNASEVERWERIERAAREIISHLDVARTTASADSYAAIISGQFDRLVIAGLRKDLKS